jgi:hypothetical protein
MTTRNDNIKHLYTKANYTLTEGRPHKKADGSASWDNRDRIIIASKVADHEITHAQAAERIGCDVKSIHNCIQTLDSNNPRMNG